MWENIRADYNRSSYYRKTAGEARWWCILWRAAQDSGFRAVFLYRAGRWCRLRHCGILAALLERLMRHWSHCWISTLADIGPGFVIAHVCGIIVPPNARMGQNCTIRQNVTLGGNYGKRTDDGRTNPWLGDEVEIGPGAVILGPIRIGSNTIVGANAVVTTSVPENSVVAGFRAERIAERSPDGRIDAAGRQILLSRRQLYDRLVKLEATMTELSSTLGELHGSSSTKNERPGE